jgi:integrase
MAETFRTLGQCMKFSFANHIPWMQRDADGKHIKGAASAYYALKPFVERYGHSLPVSSIDEDILESFKTDRYLEGKAAQTINLTLQALATMLDFCKKRKRLTSYPCNPLELKLPKDASVRLHYEPEQVEKLVNTARSFNWNDLSDIIVAAFTTGMRQDELLRMRVRDINFIDNVIVVGRRKDTKHVTGASKGKKIVHIPILDWLKPIIKERCRDAPPHEFVFGNDWSSRHILSRKFSRVRDFCGFTEDGYDFHSLRSSYITFSFRIGNAARTIQDIVGHANITTTLGYSHCTDKDRQRAGDNFNQALSVLSNA